MSDYFPTQNPFTIIGSKTPAGVTTGVELESTYSATEVTEPTKSFETAGFSRMSLDFVYTMGAAETSNSVEIKIEGSPDGGLNWYQLVNDSTSGATSTLTKREFLHVGTNGAASKFNIILDIAYRKVRVSGKETGVAANKGNLYAEVTLSGR